MITNIEEDTVNNTDYRRVIHTTDQHQLVLMALRPGDDVPCEVHPDITQFVRVEKGDGIVIIDGHTHRLGDGISLDIPAGTKHQIINTSSNEDLKLYTIYSPPEHPDGLIQKTKPVEKSKTNKMSEDPILLYFYLFL
jgi:mannose-6-phosphate isomerase-like protein (cupin superfamily)